MAKQLLTEIFNIKNGKFKKKDGTEVPIAYIDPSTSENTFQYKDKIKEFGAKWLGTLKTWGWFVTNPNVYNDQIKPCLEYLVSVEQNENNEARDVTLIIDKLIGEIEDGNVEAIDTSEQSVADLKAKLENFKRELVSIMSDKEFKERMLPIIKFRNAQGHSYSFSNTILIYVQDPQATMVKAKGVWERDFNRKIKDGAKPLALWVIYGGTPYSKEQKETITNRFLSGIGKTSKKELTPGEKDKLRVLLKPKGSKFKLVFNFYDVRFTEQIEGKDDLVGDFKHDDLPWFDDSGEENETTKMYCDAVISLAQDQGIKVSYVKDMGGARGVSKSGAIDVLEGVPMNSGMFNTLTHEFAHELLHQKYLHNKDTDPNGYGRYFIGTSQGRAAVEQQAELCAWIVLRNFGFDMPTNINYVGLWGMDEEKAPKVFDTVADAATGIIKGIYNKVNETMQESKTYIMMEMTGLDVAKLLGCEDIYLKYKDDESVDEPRRTAFKESFNRMLNNINATRTRNLKQPFRF